MNTEHNKKATQTTVTAREERLESWVWRLTILEELKTPGSLEADHCLKQGGHSKSHCGEIWLRGDKS